MQNRLRKILFFHLILTYIKRQLHPLSKTERCIDRHLKLKNAYTETLSITSAMYRDSMPLCQRNLYPSRYHNFYESLKHGVTEMSDSHPDE